MDNLAPTSCSLRTGSGLILLSVPLNAPVKYIIVLVALTNKQITEKLAQVGIIGLVVKAEGAAVVEEDSEFVREAAAEQVGGCGHLLLHDAIILLLLRGSLEALPRKSTTKEVHQNVGKRLEIITASLFDTQVSVNGSVTCSTRQILVLPIRNVKVSLRVSEFLRQTKVNDVDLVPALADSHEEVIRFDVAVNEVTGVNIFDT